LEYQEISSLNDVLASDKSAVADDLDAQTTSRTAKELAGRIELLKFSITQEDMEHDLFELSKNLVVYLHDWNMITLDPYNILYPIVKLIRRLDQEYNAAEMRAVEGELAYV
jgi:hypothetical protein